MWKLKQKISKLGPLQVRVKIKIKIKTKKRKKRGLGEEARRSLGVSRAGQLGLRVFLAFAVWAPLYHCTFYSKCSHKKKKIQKNYKIFLKNIKKKPSNNNI